MRHFNIACAVIALTLAVTSPELVAQTDERNSASDWQYAWQSVQRSFHEGWLEGKAEAALLFNEHLNSFAIDVDVDGEVMALDGEVSSREERNLAEELALGLNGVESVNNRLQVTARESDSSQDFVPDMALNGRSFSQFVDDISTTASIKTELLASEGVSGLDIDVDTFRDVVTLNGVVDSREQRHTAEVVARKRRDVLEVENRLRVGSSY